MNTERAVWEIVCYIFFNVLPIFVKEQMEQLDSR